MNSQGDSLDLYDGFNPPSADWTSGRGSFGSSRGNLHVPSRDSSTTRSPSHSRSVTPDAGRGTSFLSTEELQEVIDLLSVPLSFEDAARSSGDGDRVGLETSPDGVRRSRSAEGTGGRGRTDASPTPSSPSRRRPPPAITLFEETVDNNENNNNNNNNNNDNNNSSNQKIILNQPQMITSSTPPNHSHHNLTQQPTAIIEVVPRRRQQVHRPSVNDQNLPRQRDQMSQDYFNNLNKIQQINNSQFQTLPPQHQMSYEHQQPVQNSRNDSVTMPVSSSGTIKPPIEETRVTDPSSETSADVSTPLWPPTGSAPGR